MAQSALGFGAFSYVIDRMGQQPANAAAATVCCEADGSCKRLLQQVRVHIHAESVQQVSMHIHAEIVALSVSSAESFQQSQQKTVAQAC